MRINIKRKRKYCPSFRFPGNMDPPYFHYFILYCFINCINSMVEAAGIEPASEDIATRTSTSLVYNLNLASTAPVDKVRFSQSAKVSPV